MPTMNRYLYILTGPIFLSFLELNTSNPSMLPTVPSTRSRIGNILLTKYSKLIFFNQRKNNFKSEKQKYQKISVGFDLLINLKAFLKSN